MPIARGDGFTFEPDLADIPCGYILQRMRINDSDLDAGQGDPDGAGFFLTLNRVGEVHACLRHALAFHWLPAKNSFNAFKGALHKRGRTGCPQANVVAVQALILYGRYQPRVHGRNRHEYGAGKFPLLSGQSRDDRTCFEFIQHDHMRPGQHGRMKCKTETMHMKQRQGMANGVCGTYFPDLVYGFGIVEQVGVAEDGPFGFSSSTGGVNDQGGILC